MCSLLASTKNGNFRPDSQILNQPLMMSTIDGYRPMFCLSPEQFSQIQHYREKHLNLSAEHKGSSQEG